MWVDLFSSQKGAILFFFNFLFFFFFSLLFLQRGTLTRKCLVCLLCKRKLFWSSMDRVVFLSPPTSPYSLLVIRRAVLKVGVMRGRAAATQLLPYLPSIVLYTGTDALALILTAPICLYNSCSSRRTKKWLSN